MLSKLKSLLQRTPAVPSGAAQIDKVPPWVVSNVSRIDRNHFQKNQFRSSKRKYQAKFMNLGRDQDVQLSSCTVKLTKIQMFPALRLPRILPHLTDPTRTCRDGRRPCTALPLPNVALRSSTVPEPSFDKLKERQKSVSNQGVCQKKVLQWNLQVAIAKCDTALVTCGPKHFREVSQS